MASFQNDGAKRKFVSRMRRLLGLDVTETPDGPPLESTARPRRSDSTGDNSAVRRAGFESRLRSMLSSAEPVAAGKLQILNLAALRARAGSEGGKSLERIHLFAEAVLRRSLGPSDVFIRYDEDNYALVFPGLDETAARVKTVAIGDEILAKLFGACRELGELRIAGGAAALGGEAATEAARPCTDALFELLDAAPVTSLAPPKRNECDDGSPPPSAPIAAAERLQMAMGEALAQIERSDTVEAAVEREAGGGRTRHWQNAELSGLLRAELEEAIAILGMKRGIEWDALERLIEPARELLIRLEQSAARPDTACRWSPAHAAARTDPLAAEADRLTASVMGRAKPVYRYEPVLNLKQNVISTYRCVFTVKRDGVVHWGEDCVRYPLARDFHPAADLLILARASRDLATLLAAGKRCAISVTVHADTLSSPSQSQLYLAALAKLPAELRDLLLVEIVAFATGVWPEKILQTAQALAPLVRACFVRLNLSYPNIRDLGFGPVRGITSCFPPAQSVGQTPYHLPMFTQKVRAARLVSCIGGIKTPVALNRIREAGVVFAYGPAVATPVPEPMGIIAIGELFSASADRDPRSLPARAAD